MLFRSVVASNEDELRLDSYFIKIIKINPLAREGDIPPDEYSITFSVITDSKQ